MTTNGRTANSRPTTPRGARITDAITIATRTANTSDPPR